MNYHLLLDYQCECVHKRGQVLVGCGEAGYERGWKVGYNLPPSQEDRV